jgi:hypothetical protein
MQPTKRKTTTAIGSSVLICGLMLGLSTALLIGCTIDTHKQGDGDNVKISTPFGGLSVKTDDSAVALGTGLPIYPGAQVVKKKGKDNKDNDAADINMSFGSFQLRVKAISYHTSDSSDKVLAFYRKGLSRFGTVIQCSDHQPVGTPTHTPDGLDCSDDSDNNKAKIKMNESFSDKIELKAGSKQHQHLVTIDTDGSGTKFGLVALDLPGHLPFSDNDADSGGKPRKQE